MSLDHYVAQMLPAIEDELHAVLERSIPIDYHELRKMLAYHLGWEGDGAGPEARGKRIRPVLVLLSCTAAGGDWITALPAAASVELLHNFSLLHDDIQDQSQTRRGRPTVWVEWGEPQAINAGDTMYTMAYSALSRLVESTSLQIAFQAQDTLQQTCLRLTQGQYLDISFEQRPGITLAEYWSMVEGKTAALISACTKLGSLVAGSDGATQAAFQQFGHYLGLAFQVQDDYLGIWGDSVLTGKSTESDLVSGKKTFPILYALEQHGEFAKRWEEGPIKVEQVTEFARLLTQSGAREYVQETVDRLTHLALEALNVASQEDQATNALIELAERLVQRQV